MRVIPIRNSCYIEIAVSHTLAKFAIATLELYPYIQLSSHFWLCNLLLGPALYLYLCKMATRFCKFGNPCTYINLYLQWSVV